MPSALDTVLHDFHDFIAKFCRLDIFHSLMVSVLQISNAIKKEQLSLQLRDWIENILAASKAAKSIYSKDLHTFHGLLSKVVGEMSMIDDEGHLRDRLKGLSSWMVGIQVDIETIRTDNNLVDYVKELEELRDKFADLNELSKKVGSRNEQLTRSEEELSRALDAERKKAEKVARQNDRISKTYEEIKAKYALLFEKYNELLVQKEQSGADSAIQNKSATKEKKPPTHIWFDFDKARERYEDMLDDMQKVS